MARTQQRKPQNQTKLRSLLSGRMVTVSFHVSDKAEEADISKREIKFVYTNKGEFVFSEIKDQSQRFSLPESLIGNSVKFLKTNTVVDALTFTNENEEDKIIGIKLPIKVDLIVKDAPPSMKGNTTAGGGKLVTLETGASITAPLFIEAGDIIRINTDTGEYVERAEKK